MYAPHFDSNIVPLQLAYALLKYLGTLSVPIFDPRVDLQILGTLYVVFGTSGTPKVTKRVRYAYLF